MSFSFSLYFFEGNSFVFVSRLAIKNTPLIIYIIGRAFFKGFSIDGLKKYNPELRLDTPIVSNKLLIVFLFNLIINMTNINRITPINRGEINLEKYNSLINRSPDVSVYCESWYLDAVCENWFCLVLND